MTNAEVLQIAMEQSAIDANCNADDFRKSSNVVVTSTVNRGHRQYLRPPFHCNLISYGTNVVASVDPVVADV